MICDCTADCCCSAYRLLCYDDDICLWIHWLFRCKTFKCSYMRVQIVPKYDVLSVNPFVTRHRSAAATSDILLSEASSLAMLFSKNIMWWAIGKHKHTHSALLLLLFCFAYFDYRAYSWVCCWKKHYFNVTSVFGCFSFASSSSISLASVSLHRFPISV